MNSHAMGRHSDNTCGLMNHLIVDARMGAGKTKVSMSVLDNQLQNFPKKLPIFPTKTLMTGFMEELLRWQTSPSSCGFVTSP